MRLPSLLTLGGIFIMGYVLAHYGPAQRAPFRFLDGRTALKWEADAQEIQRKEVAFYSFKADYSKVMEKARAELDPLGYKFKKWKNGCYLQKGPNTDPTPMVVINGACRMKNTSGAEQVKFWNDPASEKGWVSVEVEGLRELSG